MIRIFTMLVLLAVSASLYAETAVSKWSVTGKTSLSGDQGWDYLTLDSAARRLYISRADHIAVLNADTMAPIAEIKDTAGVHGVALAPTLKRGFTSNGKASTVTAFDLASAQPIATFKTGDRPDAIIFEPITAQVLTFNAGSKDASVIDAKSGKITATIALEGKPEFAAVDGAGLVFVNIEDKNSIAAIDVKLKKRTHVYPLAPCEAPTGLAMDQKGRRLFAACENHMLVVINADTGKVVQTVPIGAGPDAVGYDAEDHLVFTSNGQDGTVTIIQQEKPDRYTVAQTVPTEKGARTLALDEKTHRLVLVTAQFGPPAKPTAEHPRSRPTIVPGSVVALTVSSGSKQ